MLRGQLVAAVPEGGWLSQAPLASAQSWNTVIHLLPRQESKAG